MPTTPKDIFGAMPDAFLPEKAGQIELDLQFNLSGDQGGQWAVQIKNGTCSTHTGQVDDPLATISTSAEDFMALFTGELNAVAAYMAGRVKVAGDVTAIMNLLSFFALPKK
jgi:putative sterol carrier protein